MSTVADISRQFDALLGPGRGSDRPPTTAEVRVARVAELIATDDDSVVYPLAEISTNMAWRLRFALVIRGGERGLAVQQMSADADPEKWPWEGYDWVLASDEANLARMCERSATQLAKFSATAPTAAALLALLDSSLGLS